MHDLKKIENEFVELLKTKRATKKETNKILNRLDELERIGKELKIISILLQLVG